MALKCVDAIMTIVNNKEVMIMVTLEQVEKLRERTGISYEEAKRVLEETGGDLLDAMIKLERQNRIEGPEMGGYYHSKGEKEKAEHSSNEKSSKKRAKDDNGESFGETLESFFKWCGKVLHKGNINSFNVEKDGAKVMVVPLTVFGLLLIFAFWIVLPIMILGLIFGYRYFFTGPDLENTEVNRAMDTVSDATLRVCDAVDAAVTTIKKGDKQNKGDNANGENPDNRR
jgi:hypothetical protein